MCEHRWAGREASSLQHQVLNRLENTLFETLERGDERGVTSAIKSMYL